MITITGVWKLVIVTISREYGALGHAVTRGLTQQLGYRLVDDDLPVVVAARLGTSPELVEHVENRSSGFGERFLRSLGGVSEAFQAIAPVDDLSDATLREVERLIREAADSGNVVVVGRAGNVILAGRCDLVRVFLTAPVPWRAAHIAESLSVSDAAARAEVARVDAGRRAFMRERYDVAWGQRHNYDVVVDVSAFGVDGTVAILATAVAARS